jgi:hypothetical protein
MFVTGAKHGIGPDLIQDESMENSRQGQLPEEPERRRTADHAEYAEAAACSVQPRIRPARLGGK